MNNVMIDFTQNDSMGENTSYGTLLIVNNSKFRINYYPPSPLLIVGNHKTISVYDYEMDSVFRIATQESLNIFLINEYEQFIQKFQIIGYRNDKILESFELVHKDFMSNIKLVFHKKDHTILQLEIIEQSGNKISVHFTATENILKASRHLFVIKNPDVFGVPKRLSKSMLRMEVSQ